MNEIEIDIIETEQHHALLEGSNRRFVALIAVPELGGDKYLLPRDPTLPDRLSDVAFVPVEARGVD